MLEFLIQDDDDALGILKRDHDTVKDIFSEFERSDDRREKKSLVAQAVMELKIHATIEEELFYPSLRGKEEVEQDLLNEADEEHHVAKLLIAELDQMDGSEDHFDAKFTVLSENIRHHIKEEENGLFPQARRTDVDFILLGRRLNARKTQLKENGIPASAEEKMIGSRRKGSADSPAQNAKKHKAPQLVSHKPAGRKPSAKKPERKMAAKAPSRGHRPAKKRTRS